MGRSSIGSSYTAPPSIEPHVGKIGEDGIESETNDCCDVFKEQVARSNDASNADDFGPEAAARTLRNACAIAGVANVLAREARCDAIHASRVFGWIEQPNVSLMHVQVGEPSLCSTFSEDLAAVSVPLNSGNWRVSEDEIGKESASSSCE
jgi:hypothetical protein